MSSFRVPPPLTPHARSRREYHILRLDPCSYTWHAISAAGPVLETCVITLTPITVNGETLFREEQTCTVTSLVSSSAGMFIHSYESCYLLTPF